MNCPACGLKCQSVRAGSITVEVCRDGCGGIWFDNFELEKVDEAHEAAGEMLIGLPRRSEVSPDPTRQLECPRCSGQPMIRHFFSVKRQVQVDVCPNCGGTWLDLRELAQIREQFASESARRLATEHVFEDLFDGDLTALRSESQEGCVKARQLARIFRFLCPSYYVPGKQTWGAF
ncbi:MAG: zf-TFIIB domain-containing protein [Candidatus Eisenbacteria sp.]|nr:zf-TFIIB domain-containing protein [Candidatus Eisenbacteria bacterium]